MRQQTLIEEDNQADSSFECIELFMLNFVCNSKQVFVLFTYTEWYPL